MFLAFALEPGQYCRMFFNFALELGCTPHRHRQSLTSLSKVALVERPRLCVWCFLADGNFAGPVLLGWLRELEFRSWIFEVIQRRPEARDYLLTQANPPWQQAVIDPFLLTRHWKKTNEKDAHHICCGKEVDRIGNRDSSWKNPELVSAMIKLSAVRLTFSRCSQFPLRKVFSFLLHLAIGAVWSSYSTST
jgi:hypothetical protein